MTLPMIMVPVSPGELIDKITILEIKKARIDDADKKANVERELEHLANALDHHVAPSVVVTRCRGQLAEINARLWDTEEQIRALEHEGDFGAAFVALARQVYLTNDERFLVKREINTALGATIFEEKSHA